MALYILLTIQEQLFYINLITEAFNIAFFSAVILGIVVPSGFLTLLGILNLIYLFDILFIVFFIRGTFRKTGFVLLGISILKVLFWEANPIINILDSVICMAILTLSHIPLFGIITQLEEEIIEQMNK